MKKLSISSALLAIAVIVISAFTQKKTQQPTLGQLANGDFIELDDDNYHCSFVDDRVCKWIDEETPDPESLEGVYTLNTPND